MTNKNQTTINLKKSAWTVSSAHYGYISESGSVISRDENSDDSTYSGIFSFTDAFETLKKYLNDNDNCTDEILNEKGCAFYINLEDSTELNHTCKTYFSIKGKDVLKLRIAGQKF